MRILYVGHGRYRTNWGARATSTALHDLLATTNTISGVIESAAKDANYVRILSFPPFSNGLLKKIDSKNPRVFNFLSRVARKAGVKIGVVDYINENIDKSINNFYKRKDKYPELAAIYKMVQECDAVVLNGEGSFIFKTPARRDALFFLFILKLAITLGKKAYYLNAIISDCPVTGRNMRVVNPMMELFKSCKFITLRDPLSYRELNDIAKTPNSKYIPDALFSWYKHFENRKHLPVNAKEIILNKTNKLLLHDLDFSKPYICISGSSLAAWNKNKATPAYEILVNKLKSTGIQVYIVPTCHGDSFLNIIGKKSNTPVNPLEIDILTGGAILANAAVFVSGRYHPSILASLGGTPCVFMGSNSHKIVSLQEMLGYTDIKEYAAIPTERDIDNILADVISLIKQGKERRDVIFNNVKQLADKAREISLLVR